MKIHLIAIENSPPQWVNQGYETYQKRLPADYELRLISVPAIKRKQHLNTNDILKEEGERLLRAVPRHSCLIALDRLGQSITTQKLSAKLLEWHDDHQDISILIGGPEGLSTQCLQRSQVQWSLSALTLPHPLVKVVMAEQLYRAWSILQNHPYHK